MSRRSIASALTALGLVSLSAVSLASAHAAPNGVAPGALELQGTFRLAHPSCAGGSPRGSYLSVTFGTRAIKNPQSSCADGAYTLLSPGSHGLSTQTFSPASDAEFNSHGSAVANTIAEPTTFAGHVLGLVSSTDNLQDAPTGPAEFALPQVYLVNGKLVADLRSVQVLYNGPDDASCAQAAGQGCWLVGAERATGTYDARTHAFTLDWFSGQSFTPDSAGTIVHLAGTFVGAKKPVPKGHVVELGTQSFSAGNPSQAETAAASHSSSSTGTNHHLTTAAKRRLRRRRAAELALKEQTAGRSTSPKIFAIGEAAVVLDVLALLAFGRKRRTS